MINVKSDDNFATFDLALASILKQAGLTYTINRQEERRVFYFQPKVKAEKIAGDYYRNREALKGEMFNES